MPTIQSITAPPMLDTTGQTIVSKLEAIKNAVQPTNPCLDIDIAIPANGWSSSSPYTYTYENAHITSGCAVKVNFLEGSSDTKALYLEYEKVTGGVRFTAPVKPTAEIAVRLHVLNADATAVVATTADEVSTSAVSGAANVEDALGSLSEHIGNKKYVSGVIEFEVTSASDWIDWGGWKRLERNLSTISFGGAFTNTPYVIATPFNGGTDNLCSIVSVWNNRTNITRIDLTRPTASTGTYKIRWLAIGT